MNIKIGKTEINTIIFNYNEDIGDKALNFDELLQFAKYLIALPNFQEINKDEIEFECEPELDLYKSTIIDLISSIQADQELLEVISESSEQNPETPINDISED